MEFSQSMGNRVNPQCMHGVGLLLRDVSPLATLSLRMHGICLSMIKADDVLSDRVWSQQLASFHVGRA